MVKRQADAQQPMLDAGGAAALRRRTRVQFLAADASRLHARAQPQAGVGLVGFGGAQRGQLADAEKLRGRCATGNG